MKKQNQYYSQEFWKYASQNKEKWSKKSLYEISIKRWQWVQKNHNYWEHEKISSWKKYTDDQCKKHYLKKKKAWWKFQKLEHYVKEKRYH